MVISKYVQNLLRRLGSKDVDVSPLSEKIAGRVLQRFNNHTIGSFVNTTQMKGIIVLCKKAILIFNPYFEIHTSVGN